jgi:hypothetical protein
MQAQPELEAMQNVIDEYTSLVAEQTRRIRALTLLATEMIGTIGVSLPASDPVRSDLIHRGRATIWPDKWRLNENGKAEWIGPNISQNVQQD